MKPDSTNEPMNKKDNFYLEQIGTPTINELKGSVFKTVKDLEDYKKRLRAVLDHVPEYCLMCSNHKWKKDGQWHYMGKKAFKHHLTSMMGPDGQRLNRDVIDGMYKRYREIVESLRRTSKIANRPCQNVIFTIGVLA